MRAAVDEAGQRTDEARVEGVRAARERSLSLAVDQAHRALHTSVARFEPQGWPAFSAHCRGLLDAERPRDALSCTARAAELGHDGVDLGLLRADALLGTGDYAGARAVLFDLRDSHPQLPGLSERILTAFMNDPQFLRPVLTIERGVQVSQIRALGGGSTITLKFKLDGETIAAFKPNQTRRQSNYRAEVAAYRLCPMIRCGFEVPYSFEVRVEQRDFLRLYGIPSLEGNTGYAAEFVDLVWTTEDGREYLHGVWKDWVPHFTEFPIEYDDVWGSWVAVDGDPTELDRPLAEALAPLRGRERGNYDAILAEAADATTAELARQISNMLVFDFLINNWDRFSGAYYGVNCQWADGHFVSIDNGAGFMTRDAVRPRRRLQQATRFSRSVIREVRLLDRDRLIDVLFPNPTDQERRDFESFWERRDELLEFVDGLVEEHGEDAVLFFE